MKQRPLSSAVMTFDRVTREKEKKWRKPGVENSCVPLFAGTQSK